MSRRLLIDGGGQTKVYEDLDHILATVVQPMADIVRSITEHKVFKNTTDRDEVGAQLMAEKATNTQRIPYSFSPIAGAPGRFWLAFVPGRSACFQVSTATARGVKRCYC